MTVGCTADMLLIAYFSGTARNTLSQPNVWLAIFLSIALCVLPVVGFRFLKALLRPTASDKVSRHFSKPETLFLPARHIAEPYCRGLTLLGVHVPAGASVAIRLAPSPLSRRTDFGFWHSSSHLQLGLRLRLFRCGLDCAGVRKQHYF